MLKCYCKGDLEVYHTFVISSGSSKVFFRVKYIEFNRNGLEGCEKEDDTPFVIMNE